MQKINVEVYYGEENFEKLFSALLYEKINEIQNQVHKEYMEIGFNKGNIIRIQPIKGEADTND